MLKTRIPALAGAVLAAACLAQGAGAAAQSVATRTPNFAGGWTAAPGVVQINFLHRFTLTDAPLRKVINTPTFNVSTGLTDRISAGFTYGSNSTLVPAYPNEWELYGRAMALDQNRGAPLDLSVQAGWNAASESVDGEVLLARNLGRLRVLAAGRAFSEGYDGTEARYALAGGAALRLSSSVSVAGDYAVLLDRADDERAAWGAGLQLGVPYTPHSFSIHATNVGTASLEGASRGTRTRWGFEYTIPITIRRYVPSGGGDDMASAGIESGDMSMADPAMSDEMRDAMAEGGGMMMMGDTVVIEIQNIKYGMEEVRVAPGTPVKWVNRDPIQHSVTAEDESFDSGLLDPLGGAFVMTFTRPGTYAYHCTPHPFMKGIIVVEEMDGAREGGEER